MNMILSCYIYTKYDEVHIHFRALHDVKATDMGSTFVRFKAEVDFDGKEITRYYLEKQDLDQMLQVQ